jgi:hypothetical protein
MDLLGLFLYVNSGGPNGKHRLLSIVAYCLLSRIIATARVSTIQKTPLSCAVLLRYRTRVGLAIISPRFQSKARRIITDAPWYVPYTAIRKESPKSQRLNAKSAVRAAITARASARTQLN